MHGVVFGADAGASALTVQPVLLPLALATSVLGVLGALAAHTLPRLVAWLTVVSVGTVVSGIGLFTDDAWSAALFYLVNSTLVIAGLFLLAELVAAQRGVVGARLRPASQVAQPQLLGLMLLLAAASVAGLPPLPGFIGKLMILEAALASPAGGRGLGGRARRRLADADRRGARRQHPVLECARRPGRRHPVRRQPAPARSPRWRLLSASVLMTHVRRPLQRYTAATAVQLNDRSRLRPRGARQRAMRLPIDNRAALYRRRAAAGIERHCRSRRDEATPDRDRSTRWLVRAIRRCRSLLAASWLLLQQSLALPQLIAAGVLGLLLPRLIGGFLGHVGAAAQYPLACCGCSASWSGTSSTRT